jgi:putative peptidoglycan lipid II flippase
MNLLKALGTVSGFTLLSRVTGLLREIIMAAMLGASAYSDAFFVAFRLPNLLRRIFAEGAFSQAFVPTLARHKAAGTQESTKSLIDSIASALFWSLLLVTILGIIAAPILVYIMATGLAKNPEAFSVAVIMTRWMFPYILMISLVALSAGILNTYRKFALPAFTPVLLNLSFIVCSLALSKQFAQPVYALVVGVVLGGIVQLAIQIPALHKLGLLPKINANPFAAFKDPEVRQVMKLMAPILLSVSVAQISLIINTNIASHVAVGAVSWITYADRLMEFPTAMLGVALGVVLTPSLSAAHQRKDAQQYSALLDWGLRICVLLAIPAMVGLALLSQPLTALLFHRGQFSAVDVQNTAAAVAAYGFGIIGLVAIKILAPGFFARQDTRTPVTIAIAVLIITQILNWILIPYLGHVALALSISIGALINAAWMLIVLIKHGAYKPKRGWTLFLLTIIAASASMAFALAMLDQRIDWIALQANELKRAFYAFTVIFAAAAIYFGLLSMLGLDMMQLFKKRAK